MKMQLLSVFFLFIAFQAQSQVILPNYDLAGRELPPGVPKMVDTNGNVIYVNPMFTTGPYREHICDLLLKEANQVAQELQLSEKLPITRSNLVGGFISPFGFTYAYKKVGNISTTNYNYGVEQDYKFSDLALANLDEHCLEYRAKYQWPTNRINTAEAYQLATQWLVAAHMNVNTLNKECRVKVDIDHFWNGLRPGEKIKKKTFVPIYNVSWLSPKNQSDGYGDVAYVTLFAPTKKLLELTVYDSKYILRPPVVFTNLTALFPGKGTVTTNWPVKPQPGPLPGME